ncbi:uncharacterized protein Bfra_006888 [Botrytis fragariae]|uniref:Uncharacterized protein n=1 Tax=Botrytis fragariae TaxID=1964551 RepID=A0A8H6B5B9_9HELO|nr:uncharacterized protein Bfra_006888 [Botrytis fragariae]KAF5879681.1 hypothetical protein Bfra_006888 [Botrytis fragariae]
MAAGSYSSKIRFFEAADLTNAPRCYKRAVRCLPAKFSVNRYTKERQVLPDDSQFAQRRVSNTGHAFE